MMTTKSLEELARDGTLTNPGAIQLAQGIRELLGFDNPVAKVLNALEFAADEHRNQRRKDADASPYINHSIALARLLACEALEQDGDILAAAALHDTVEDTDTTFEEIKAGFGGAIADIVREVTDDKTIEKAERKRLQIEYAARASMAAKAVKLADKICNLRDLNSAPPADWSIDRRREYFDWAKQVVDAMRGSYPLLERFFDAEYARRP
ncbi:MAG: HD domain-containing protein [Pseudomonadota bacterium]|nr:HD domain-containing protein [Pseudomonadota bacterium]